MSILLGLYVQVGLAGMFHHPSPEPPETYWKYDVTQIVNPYGTAEIGWERDIGHFQLDLALRHDSSIPAGDFGQNTAEVRLKWFPFR